MNQSESIIKSHLTQARSILSNLLTIMDKEKVVCPQCFGSDLIKRGTNKKGYPEYRCLNTLCPRSTFIIKK